MAVKKYKYNTRTLAYEKIEVTFKDRLLTLFKYTLTGLVFSVFIVSAAYVLFDSPKEKMLKRENAKLIRHYEMLNGKMAQLEEVLQDMQYRDDNIYRTIFEADPIPTEIRKAGFGGVNRYKDLEGFDNSTLLINANSRLDQITKSIYIQSKSFDEVYEMALRKEDMLMSIPSVQPIANKDLKRMASGFGFRMHPILKVRKMHPGMDFSAAVGTEIYATGNGKIIEVIRASKGYGNHVVVDHGYGYKTLYAHMSAFNVRKGQLVKRGEVIGYVGNSGLSRGPHLHYEVIKDGMKVNPANFYFNDLTPEQFEQMIEMSSIQNQSLD